MARPAAVLLAVLLAVLASRPARGEERVQLSQKLEANQAFAAIIGAADAGARPVKTSIAGHDVYFQLPPGGKPPRGLVLLLHKCGRSGSDFWPKSPGCLECEGLPHSLAKTKQALNRGYAVAAMSSGDRRTGGGGVRCFSWNADAKAAAELVRTLPKRLGMRPGAPVYVDGASSGGSIALRLPMEVAVDGIVGEVIAPGGFDKVLDDIKKTGRAMPPSLYIHMPFDAGMKDKVATNIEALRERRIPVGEIRVLPQAVVPTYFARCSPLISPQLSAMIQGRMRAGGYIDGAGNILRDIKLPEWSPFWTYLASGLRDDVKVQELHATPLIAAHVKECIGVAWARHETVGEYMTAALEWLESGGRKDAAALAKQRRVANLAQLRVKRG